MAPGRITGGLVRRITAILKGQSRTTSPRIPFLYNAYSPTGRIRWLAGLWHHVCIFVPLDTTYSHVATDQYDISYSTSMPTS